VIKAAHRADVARIEFNEKEFDNLEGTVQQWGEKLGEYSEKVQNLLMLSRGKPASPKARNIQAEALKQLKKEAPELVGTRDMINIWTTGRRPISSQRKRSGRPSQTQGLSIPT
jgi:hypothetical protein